MPSFVAFLAKCLAAPFLFLFRRTPRSSIHGDARWMSFFERRSFLARRNKGLVLSPKYWLSLEESFRNLLLVAPTGSGKTTRFVVPNVLLAEGSLVLTDPSGEIFRLTSGHLAERGYSIQVLSPSNIEKSLRFNPLLHFGSPSELRRLATILGQAAGDDLFWKNAAINLLFLTLSALANVEDPALRHLGNLRLILNSLSPTPAGNEPVLTFLCRYLDAQMFTELRAFLAQDPKVIASTLSSARVALDLWADPAVVNLTAADTLQIRSLRERPTALFLIVPEHRISYFALLLNLVYSACFEFCLERAEGLPVFFLMDEAGNLGRIHNLPSIITTLRKRRCSVSLVLQAFSQLTAIYGREEANSIISGGINHRLFFSGLDLDTCRSLEQILGRQTAIEPSVGVLAPQDRSFGKPLLSADEIRMLPKDAAILVSGRERPVRFRMPPFFSSRRLQRLTEMKPVDVSPLPGGTEIRWLEL